MPFKIVRNDLTKMRVDAIVNTANEAPTYSTGTDTAVYKAAGEEELLKERRKIGFMEEGEVAITPGFKLPAKYIIHAVSPCYIDGTFDEEEKLRSCYRKSLELSYEYKCESIAFPLIATGSFGYPKEEGMRIALDEIHGFLFNHDMLIYLVVFDTEATRLGAKMYPDLEAYIDHNYVCDKREEEYGDRYFGSIKRGEPKYNEYERNREIFDGMVIKPSIPVEEKRAVESCKKESRPKTSKNKKDSFTNSSFSIFKKKEPELEPILFREEACDFSLDIEDALQERMTHMTDTFQEYLFYLIDSKNLTNVEVYKNALVSKKLFSKINSNPDYHPDKATAMRLCVGAKLNLDETRDLLARAGYALSPCDKRDIIFSYFIEKEIFDMIEIDITLEEYGLPCFIK